jgi:hypothetical protein
LSAEAWIARSGAALCRGARWPLAFSFALSVLAGARLLFEPRLAPLVLILVLAAGIGQAYFALRIEFDRIIFERFAEDPASAPEFDAALVQAGWAKSPVASRSMADRVQGMHRFVKAVLLLLFLQVGALGWAAA